MKHKSITVKIFLVTAALLITSTAIIYAFFYFLLPHFYLQHKQSTLEKGIEQLVGDVKSRPVDDVKTKLDTFAHEYNVGLSIINQNGQIVYTPSPFFEDADKQDSFSLFAPEHAIPAGAEIHPVFPAQENAMDILTFMKPIQFSDHSPLLMLYVSAPLQPIDEASDVIMMFMPYMLGIVVCISVVSAFIYSKIIANPLLALNRVAKRMAKLDFSAKSAFSRKDEIGELGHNLNELSANLQRALHDLHQANDKLKDDITRERELEAKRREFVTTISHELKSPLTATLGQLEGMIHQIGAYRDREKYLRQSFHILKEMEQLVHDLLDVYRLESKDFHPRRSPVYVTALVENIVESHQFFLDEKQMQLSLDLQEDIIIRADEKLLKKALSNVIRNAIQYSPREKKVSVQLTEQDDEVTLQVENTGASIAEQELANVFQPFYRVEKSRNRKTGGSGLGLFIVKQILDRHGARYRLENTSSGVRFSVVWPLS